MLREFNALFPQADFVLAGGAPGDLQRIKAHQGLTLFCNAAGTSRYVPPETFTQVARQGASIIEFLLPHCSRSEAPGIIGRAHHWKSLQRAVTPRWRGEFL